MFLLGFASLCCGHQISWLILLGSGRSASTGKLRFPVLRAFALSEEIQSENLLQAPNFLVDSLLALLNLDNILWLGEDVHFVEEFPGSLVFGVLEYFFWGSVFYNVSFVEEDDAI